MSAAPAQRVNLALQEDAARTWSAQIDAALGSADPALANVRITVAHHQLSAALQALLGPHSGANFHTWATWGSRKAGQTIRQEEAPWLEVLALGLGAGLGLLGALLAPPPTLPARLLACVLGVVLGGGILLRVVQERRAQASRLILEGNRTVLDDIGHATARFIDVVASQTSADPRRLALFLDGLRPGPSTEGGQDLLRAAFTHYYQARDAPTPAERDAQMLLGNLQAILHEHLRLQPYIAGALPRPARRLITRHLSVLLGRHTLRVSAEVGSLGGGACLPSLQNAELRAFLGAWESAAGRRGGGATNWAHLGERMAYICALFCAGHHAPDLFLAPYTPAQQAEIAGGRVPAGSL